MTIPKLRTGEVTDHFLCGFPMEDLFMFRGIFFFLKSGWHYDKRYILWRLLFQIVHSIIPVIATIFPKYIIDELTGTRDVVTLTWYIGILTGYTLLATLLSNYFSWDGFSRRCRVAAEFSNDLHRRLAECDFERLEESSFLDMQEKAKKFLYCDWHGFGYLLDCAMTIIGQCFTLAGISAVIVTLDWKIVVVFLICTVISAKIESVERKKAMHLSQKITREERGWHYYAELFENFNYGKEIRINSMGKWLLSRERSYFQKVNANFKQRNDTYIRAGNWSAFFTFLQRIFAYSYLIHGVLGETISIGSFTMYVGAVTTFSIALKGVIESITEIRAYDMYYDNLDDYLSVPTKLRTGKRQTSIPRNGTLEFKHVSFRYPGSKHYALKDVTLSIQPGEKLSIVGENGAGKTTFVKLLTRLYDPTEGEILLDGINIKDIAYEQYMSFFSAVYQDYKLFSFSLKDNIALTLPVDECKIEQVLKRVGLWEKIQSLPQGINTTLYTNLEEIGFEPSGGEGQKIALARALYKDAPFVILDEPTAALDPRAEYEIYRQFHEMTKEKTAVSISHRLSSAKFCDKVAVFSGGKLIEYGTHSELIKREGLYQEFFDLQAEPYK